MKDTQLFAQILGIHRPWAVSDVNLEPGTMKVTVRVRYQGPSCCPECGQTVPGYDKRTRQWRHLDTCQYQTILEAEVPRVNCPEHGVRLIEVPWAEQGSRFTALMEAFLIEWCKHAPVDAVSRQTGVSWSALDRVLARAVQRGLARRKAEPIPYIGVDETSFKRGQSYLTIVTDLNRSRVLYCAPDRNRAVLEQFYESLSPQQHDSVQQVAMDMWQAYIGATEAAFPDRPHIIAFDKFHVAQHLGNAVDKVRRTEHKALRAEGDERLNRSRYLWLRNPDNMTDEQWFGRFENLRTSNLRTARAWAIREQAMCLWHYRSRGHARRAWKRWYSWAIRSRLDPIKKVARTVKAHLEGILTAVISRVTNAGAESVNARIQSIKRRAHGYRNVDRMITAIYFHFGGLDLSPATHTIR